MLRISKIRDVKTPTRGTDKSAGLDFYVPYNFFPTNSMKLFPNQSAIIPSGIKVAVPEGYALVMFNKSGVALHQGLQVGACVIDEDYQGEIHLHVTNTSLGKQTITGGQKLVQGLLIPVLYLGVEIVDEEDLFETETTRSSGAFGSTGKY